MRHEKPDCVILTGDLNSKTKQWWPDGEETNGGVPLNQLIEGFSMTQLIGQPTHILANSSSLSDLIITDQVDMFVDSGLLPSPRHKNHQEIIYGKLNLAAPLHHHLILHANAVYVTIIKKISTLSRKPSRISIERLFLKLYPWRSCLTLLTSFCPLCRNLFPLLIK